ncbi:hypothetical protein EMCRGX_G029511 [Ephydatia muelleri]
MVALVGCAVPSPSSRKLRFSRLPCGVRRSWSSRRLRLPFHHPADYATCNDLVFDCIEEYAPGFKQLVVGKEVLTPPDLERIFGLTGGSIFHGSMSLDQLYMFRPIPLNPGYATPIKGLYLCGSGTHPGGGVMGSPGRLAATAVLEDKLC